MTRYRAVKGSYVIIAVGAVVTLLLTYLPSAIAQTPTEQNVCNDRIAMKVDAGGQLSFGAFPEPAPGCGAGSQSFPLSFSWPGGSSSFTTIRIDDQDVTFQNSGTQTVPPTAQGDAIFMSSNLGEIEVAQLVQIIPNPVTGLNDAVRISYTIDNVSPTQTPHDVGLRLFMDTKVGDSDNPTFFVNNQAVTTETDYVGNVPEIFSVQNPIVPSQAAAGTIGPTYGNTVPDRFVIGQYGSFAASLWDYTTQGSEIFDSAFGAYWDPVPVTPSSPVIFSMTYGLGVGGQAGGGDPIPGCEDTEQNQCGTTGDDNLSVSDGTVVGGPGDDTITVTVDETTNSITAEGGAGADRIILNIEDASNVVPVRLNSGDGADKVFVPKQPGVLSPVIKTGAANDVVRIDTSSSARTVSLLQDGPTGRYSVNAGGGNDRVTVGSSDDLVDGAGGDDEISGAGGTDDIEGGPGNDDMEGGVGADVLHGGDGANGFAGGPGKDTCLSDTQRDRFSSCERIRRNHRRNHLPI